MPESTRRSFLPRLPSTEPTRSRGRNPSAEANVALLPSTSILTPVNTGRASSVAAANTVRSKALRRMPESTRTRCFGDTWGKGGKSSLGAPAEIGVYGCGAVAALRRCLDVCAVRFVGDFDLDTSHVETADGVDEGSGRERYRPGGFDLGHRPMWLSRALDRLLRALAWHLQPRSGCFE